MRALLLGWALALCACASDRVCRPADGVYLVRAELRAGNPDDCGGSVQEGLETYDNGRSRRDVVECVGFRERSEDLCILDFDEDCQATDEHGTYMFRRAGNVEEVADGVYEGILELHFINYFTYEFVCVYDVTLDRQ